MGEYAQQAQRHHRHRRHRSEAHSEYFAAHNNPNNYYGGVGAAHTHAYYSNNQKDGGNKTRMTRQSRSSARQEAAAEQEQIQMEQLQEQHYYQEVNYSSNNATTAYRDLNCSSPASTTSSKFSWISNSQYFSRTSSSMNLQPDDIEHETMSYCDGDHNEHGGEHDYPNHNQDHLNVHDYGSVDVEESSCSSSLPAGFMQYNPGGDTHARSAQQSHYNAQQHQRQQMYFNSSLRYTPSIAAESHPSNASMASVRSSPRSSSSKASPKTAERKRMQNLRRSFDPTFVNIGDDFNSNGYPTFVCPRCRTRQREFISVDTARDPLDHPMFVAVFYLAIYLVMAIYIFGKEEGWPPLDCVYFAVITLTTAGLGDYTPTTPTSRLICSIFIYVGVAAIGLLLGSLLASDMDDLSRKNAKQANIDNCPNCKRVQMIHAEHESSFAHRHLQQNNRESPLTPGRKGWFSERGVYSQSSGDGEGSVFDYNNYEGGSFKSTATQNYNSIREDEVKNLSYTETVLPMKRHSRHSSLLDGRMLGGNLLVGGTHFNASQPRRRSMTSDRSNPIHTPANPALHDRMMHNPLNEDDSSEGSYSVASSADGSSTENVFQPQDSSRITKYIFVTIRSAVVNSVLVILLGSVGFIYIDNLSPIDAFYFTTVLLTTVGYGDIAPKTDDGKLFATVYVLVGGTVLLNNMSKISMIPLELRKRRTQQAVLSQFGMYLDDAALRELASGPLMQRIREKLGEEEMNRRGVMLDECTREMFSLAMLIRLGKITEKDVSLIFSAFRRLDVGNDGKLDSRDIIFGELEKRQQMTMSDLRREWRRRSRTHKLQKQESIISMHTIDDDVERGVSAVEENINAVNEGYYSSSSSEYDSAPEPREEDQFQQHMNLAPLKATLSSPDLHALAVYSQHEG